MATEVRESQSHDLLCTLRRDIVKDDVAENVKTATACTTSTLSKVEGGEERRVSGEHDRLARHVDTESKCTSGNHSGEEALAK